MAAKATMKEHQHCYVAIMPGEPGAYAICGVLPDHPEFVEEFVVKEMRAGADIQRVDRDTASRMIQEWLNWKDKQ